MTGTPKEVDTDLLHKASELSIALRNDYRELYVSPLGLFKVADELWSNAGFKARMKEIAELQFTWRISLKASKLKGY